MKLDYLRRVVCADCGHTAAMHTGIVCSAQLCYCRAFSAAGTPAAETAEVASPHKEKGSSVGSR